MRAIFLWLAIASGVATGHLVGGLESIADLDGLRLLAWAVLASVSGLVALASVVGRSVASAPGCIVVALALLVGLEAARAERLVQWPTAERGEPRGLRELEVVGASFTGASCEVAAREPGHGVTVWLVAPSEACPLASGQRVVVLASKLKLSEGSRLPGGVDPLVMVRPRGAALHVRVDDLWTLEPSRSAYWSWVARARHRAWDWTRGDEAASFVVASALGIRVALAPERRAEVRRAGLGHLIAVSGLHVALAAWFAQLVCMRLVAWQGRAPGWGVLASWVPLVAYVGLTGASPPAVRAAVMLVLFGLSIIVGRPAHGMHVLVVAAACMLLARPAWVRDPGFQLSLLAMAALVRAPAGTGLLGHSWRISWAILPVSAIHFGETGAYGVVSNLVAIPVFTLWVLPAALIGWVLTTWLGPVALVPAAWGAEIVLDLSAVMAVLPPVSLGAAASVAAASLVMHGWSGRMPALRRVLPPWLACVGTLVAWAWMQTRPTIDPGAWLAVGTPRSHATMSVLEDERGRFACLRGTTLGPAGWSRLLDALAIDRVAAVEPGSGEAADAPHLLALRDALARERRWGGDPGACVHPPAQSVAPALARCSKRVGGGSVLVLGASQASPMRCFVAGRGEPMEDP